MSKRRPLTMGEQTMVQDIVGSPLGGVGHRPSHRGWN
jgi:hypothetical protein